MHLSSHLTIILNKENAAVMSRWGMVAGSALLGLSSACGQGPTSGSEPTIAAGFYPLEYVASRVAGDRYTTENLTTPGAEPHDLSLGIKETVTITEAALVVYEDGLQPAVDASVAENAEGETLDVSSVVDLEPLEDGGSEEFDPHFWLDPLRMARAADAIASSLGELDPDHAADFRSNAEDLRADLETLDREYAAGLSSCQRDTVIVNHDAFGYLEKYGLDLVPILGLSPDAEPTAADLRRIRSIVDNTGVTTVFSETLVSKKLSETLAADLDLETGVLDPLEGLSDQTEDEDYLSIMRTNLGALQQANDCR